LIGGGTNEFAATVEDTSYTGAETHLTLRAGASTLKAVVVNSAGAIRMAIGETINVAIPAEALLVLED
jgi:hypothetical protein